MAASTSGRQSGRRGSFSGPHTGTASQSHPVRGRRTATTRYFHLWNTAKHARRPIPKLPQSGVADPSCLRARSSPRRDAGFAAQVCRNKSPAG